MTLTRYFTKIFLVRFLAVLLALCALVELLEMLDALRHLVGHHSNIKNVLIFTALRLPLALEQLFLLAVLIGATLSFRTLVQSNEMIVLRGSGLSPYRFLASLLPVALVLAGFYYAAVDRLAPKDERIFAEWWQTVAQSDDDDDAAKPKGAIWLRHNGEIISVDAVERGGKHLNGLVRYRRSADGRLSARITAKTADYANGVWRLSQVETVDVAGRNPVIRQATEARWPNGPAAENLEELALPTQRMQSAEGQQVLAGAWAGIAGAAHYRTLVQKSRVAPLLPFLMLLLATPALVGSGRRQSIRGMATGISLGLLYLVTEGFLASMSEAGVLEPVLAVWTAPLCFFALGLWLVLKNEE